MRDICAEVGISAGNFSYHFPNKDTIVVRLYENMLQEMQEEMQSVPREKVSIVLYLESHKRIFAIQIRYKFIFLNLFEVLNNYPEIRAAYIKNMNFERQMARELFKVYIHQGILKKGVTEKQFDRMINVGQILNNAWLVDAEIQFRGNKKGQLAHYMNICCGLLEPHLTEASQKEYDNYFKKLQATS